MTTAATTDQRRASVDAGGRRDFFFRAMAAPSSGAARNFLYDDVDLDDVRRARDVHRGAGGNHDRIALADESAFARRLDRAVPEVLDVRRLRDPAWGDSPLERHLPDGPVVVREADDRSPWTETRDGGGRLARERRHEHRARTE